jgi:hypothetical protein
MYGRRAFGQCRPNRFFFFFYKSKGLHQPSHRHAELPIWINWVVDMGSGHGHGL